jgi:hypothetical protein
LDTDKNKLILIKKWNKKKHNTLSEKFRNPIGKS